MMDLRSHSKWLTQNLHSRVVDPDSFGVVVPLRVVDPEAH